MVLSIVSSRTLQRGPPIIAVVDRLSCMQVHTPDRLMTNSDGLWPHTRLSSSLRWSVPAGEIERWTAAGPRAAGPAGRRLHMRVYFNNCAAVVRQHVG